MNIQDFIQSGIIEMYCMGCVSEQEKQRVEEYSLRYPEVKKEIAEVYNTLQSYAALDGNILRSSLKEKIVGRIEADLTAKQLPPIIQEKQDVNYWLNYLAQKKCFAPVDFNEIHSIDLPSSSKQTTYVVWAKKGASVEESHDDEDEYLFMLCGTCNVICNGVGQLYHSGDLVYVPKKVVHKAISYSDDMLLIGQRIVV